MPTPTALADGTLPTGIGATVSPTARARSRTLRSSPRSFHMSFVSTGQPADSKAAPGDHLISRPRTDPISASGTLA